MKVSKQRIAYYMSVFNCNKKDAMQIIAEHDHEAVLEAEYEGYAPKKAPRKQKRRNRFINKTKPEVMAQFLADHVKICGVSI